MRLLICGSRNWHDRETIEQLIVAERELALVNSEEFVVIHGHCPDGADALADEICRDLGMVPGVDLIREPAQWKRYGRSAGPRRNQKMLDTHHPDKGYAFRSGGKSSGTDDMVKRARAAAERGDLPFGMHIIPPRPVRVTRDASSA